MVFVCVSDLIQDKNKGNCCNHVLLTLIQLPQWSCQSGGDPRYLKLILACGSLKASATLKRARLLCPHSVHLLKNQCPNLFPVLKHLKQSEGLTNSVAEKYPHSPPSPSIHVLLLTACRKALLPASELSPLPLQAGCEIERVTCISKKYQLNMEAVGESLFYMKLMCFPPPQD